MVLGEMPHYQKTVGNLKPKNFWFAKPKNFNSAGPVLDQFPLLAFVHKNGAQNRF